MNTQIPEKSVGRKSDKLRVLILSAVVPIQGSGAGCLTMYRHFILNDDFEVAVAAARDFEIPDVPTLRLKQDRITGRIRKTRFARFVKNLDYLRNWYLLPKHLTNFARSFEPDVIFSVVDDEHMGLAWQLSRKLEIPLAADFQDLFAVSNFITEYSRPYPRVQQYLLQKYRFLNRNSEIVFHVGEGMRDWFGDERRGEILYPMSGGYSSASVQTPRKRQDGEPLRIIYTGNSRGAYGKMVLRFANETIDDPSLDFQIYALGTDIPEQDIKRLTDAGIFRGYLPFDDLVGKLEAADVCLLVMGFEEKEKEFVSTSFNTKWVDYVRLGKPIVVWGPGYASATQFARECGAAATVVENDAAEVVSAMHRIMQDPTLAQALKEGALAAADGPLDPQRLQCMLRTELTAKIT
jgi:hypothetical protein